MPNRELLALPAKIDIEIDTVECEPSQIVRPAVDAEQVSKEASYGKLLNNGQDLIQSRSDLETLKTVLSAYGMSRAGQIDYPEAVSVTSRKAIVTTETGKFFLKEKAKYCTVPIMLESSADFQTYCPDVEISL